MTNRWNRYASRMGRLARAGTIGALALATAACGDDEPNEGKNGSGGTGPLYLVATSFTSGDQTETYFVTTPSLEADATIDPTKGPRLLGGVVPTVHGGSVFAPEANRMVRYDLDSDDNLVKAAEFEVTGVNEVFSWHVWIVNESKGYIFDSTGLRLVVWNPSAMQLAGKDIDLSQLQREGFTPNLVFEHSGPSKRGSELLIPLGWNDQDGNSRHASGALILNADTDQVVAVAEDERCGESYATLEGPSGEVYFFPPSWSSEPHYFYDGFKPTCVLNIKPGQNTFDTAEPLNLSALGTNSAAAGAMPDGASGFFFTSANETLWDNGNNESGAFWEVYHYDFVTKQSRKVEGLSAWAGELYYVDVGGKNLVPFWEETATGQRTVLYDMQVIGAPIAKLEFASSWYGVAKLR